MVKIPLLNQITRSSWGQLEPPSGQWLRVKLSDSHMVPPWSHPSLHPCIPASLHPLRQARYQNFKISTVQPPPQLKTSDSGRFFLVTCTYIIYIYTCIYVYVCTCVRNLYFCMATYWLSNSQLFFRLLGSNFRWSLLTPCLAKMGFGSTDQPKTVCEEPLLNVRSSNKMPSKLSEHWYGCFWK